MVFPVNASADVADTNIEIKNNSMKKTDRFKCPALGYVFMLDSLHKLKTIVIIIAGILNTTRS